jgi:hypothetical protein
MTLKKCNLSKTQQATQSQDDHPLQFIPKNIFQTHASTELTEGAYKAIQTWRELNPTWNHYFFTDADQRTFIEENFSQDVLWAYDQLIPGAYKADLWRYCVLYIKGGIYVDHKLALDIPLDSVIPEELEFASYQDRPMPSYAQKELLFYVWQAFIISKPQHPFLKHAIDLVVENIKNGWYGHDTLAITGPGLLGQSINDCVGHLPKDPILPGLHKHNGLSYLILPNPFCSKHTQKAQASFLHHDNFIKPYTNYHADRDENLFRSSDLEAKDYALAWFTGKVFRHGKCVRDPSDLYFQKRAPGVLRRKARAAYLHDQKQIGRALLKISLSHRPIQPKVWWLWLKFEFFKKYFFLQK